MEARGFTADATTTMGVAASYDSRDCQVIQHSEMLETIARIVRGLGAPETVDTDSGYGNSVDEVVESIGRIISTGIVGIKIEDSVALSPVLYRRKRVLRADSRHPGAVRFA